MGCDSDRTINISSQENDPSLRERAQGAIFATTRSPINPGTRP